jgi:hypothetical protein
VWVVDLDDVKGPVVPCFKLLNQSLSRGAEEEHEHFVQYSLCLGHAVA